MSPASVASILKCGKILLHCALGDAVSDLPSFRRNADLLQKRFQRARRNTNRRPPSLKASEAVLLRANNPQSYEARARSRTDGGGFEPPVPFGTHAFQACTINRSVTHPKQSSSSSES